MTDTIDIKALSYARLIEVRNILSGFEDGYDTVADKENYEAMRDAQALIDELISARWQLVTVTTKLKAERQRADAADSRLHEVSVHCANVEAELAALKGDQVPVGFIHHLDVAELKAGGDAEIKPHKTADWQIPVFTAPQKPVEYPDTERMDWLCAHVVQVRDPMPYGSHEMFWSQCDSDDCEEHHTKLREQVDAAIEANSNKPV